MAEPPAAKPTAEPPPARPKADDLIPLLTAAGLSTLSTSKDVREEDLRAELAKAPEVALAERIERDGGAALAIHCEIYLIAARP